MIPVAERPGTPLTNPVPGVWMKPSHDAPPVYVPYERLVTKNVAGEETESFVQGAHVKRLLMEGGMLIPGPDVIETPRIDAAAQQAVIEQLQQELAELRKQLAGDQNAPNAAKRR